MGLLVSGSDTVVDMDYLEGMPDPKPLGNQHVPVRFDEIITEFQKGIERHGWELTETEMLLSRQERNLLAVMKMLSPLNDSIGGFHSNIMLGLRASTHRFHSLQCVAGAQVTLCSNLLMAGEMFVVQRKFTSGLDLEKIIDHGLDKYKQQYTDLTEGVERLRKYKLSDFEAKSVVYDSIVNGLLPMSMMKRVNENYFEKVNEDCMPRSKWGLHNAYTRALKEYPGHARFDHTQTVSRIFGL